MVATSLKKMKRIVRLTESDLTRIVKRVLKEQSDDRFSNEFYDEYAEFLDYRADIYGTGKTFEIR